MAEETVQNLIRELNERTGLHFSLDEASLAAPGAAETLEKLVRASGKKQSGKDVLRQFLSGEMPAEEALRMLPRSFTSRRTFQMMLLEFQNPLRERSAEMKILSHLFDAASADCVIMSETSAVILRYPEHTETADSAESAAAALSDTMDAEAMNPVYISYEEPCDAVEKLPSVYLDLLSAIRIGRVFEEGKRIFNYNKLGLGKLLSHLSAEEAADYLREELPGIDFESFDSETMNTIRVFFDSGLNIAESARMLFLHRNTLVYRLDRFRKMTGLDLRNFDDAVSCRIGILLSKHLAALGQRNAT